MVLPSPTPWRIAGSVYCSKQNGSSNDRASVRISSGLTISKRCPTDEDLAQFRADVNLILYAVNKLQQMRTAITRIRAMYDQLRTDWELP